MKRIKLLTPILGLTAISSVPIITTTSCGCSTGEVIKAIPNDLLDINNNVLNGLKQDADISQYNTLVVPSTIQKIKENAFAGQFTLKNKITKVIIPSSVNWIGQNAFKQCYGISVFDFTSFGADQAYTFTLANQTFGVIKYDWYANIKVSSNLTNLQKQALGQKFYDAGVPKFWLIEPTTGHLEVTNYMEQISVNGAGFHEFKALGEVSQNYEYIGVISRIDSTDGYTVSACDEDHKLIVTTEDFKHLKFETEMSPIPGTASKTGDWVTFKISIFCTDSAHDNEIKWVETFDTFKLTLEIK